MLKIFENLNKFKMTMLRKGDLDVADRQIDKYRHKYRQYGYKNTQTNPTPRIALFVGPFVTKFQPHHRYMQHSQVSRIIDMCIIHTCIRVKDRGSQICASYTHASESRIKDHRYVHHTHMHQSQGWRIIDMCIIHACIRIKDHG